MNNKLKDKNNICFESNEVGEKKKVYNNIFKKSINRKEEEKNGMYNYGKHRICNHFKLKTSEIHDSRQH